MDQTITLARELGAKLCPGTRDDDLSQAQNAALEQAKGDWLFFLQPDEELLAQSWPELRKCLQNADALAYVVQRREVARTGQQEGFAEIGEIRLFRRHPEISFQGRASPRFKIPLEQLATRAGKKVLPSSIIVQRDLSQTKVGEDRLRWSVRLIESALRDQPGQANLQVELARTLALLRDPRAPAALAEVVDLLDAFRQSPLRPPPAFQRLLEFLINAPPAEAPAGLTSREARALAQRWYPKSPPLLWAAALQEFQEGSFRQAAFLLEELIELGKSKDYDKTQLFDPDILGPAALMNLAICRRRLMNLDQADESVRPLLAHPAYAPRAGALLAEVDFLRKQSPKDLAQLQEVETWQRQATSEARQSLEDVARNHPTAWLRQKAQEALG
jgi:hypothetical protein